MVITIVSRDKLSLSMFVDFYKSLYDSDAPVLDLNLLTSAEILNEIVRGKLDADSQRAESSEMCILIKLKSKKDVDLVDLPKEIERRSHYIIRFGLFSTKPEFLKERDGRFRPIMERWEKNIEKMNGQL